MGKLILVRHGETEYNVKNIYYGWCDVGLTENGVIQCIQAKKELKKYNYDKIYSSPLIRAKKTCETINYKELEIIEDERLRELNIGIFEGYSYEEVSILYPKETKMALEKWETYNYETGESPKELQDRVMDFIKKEVDLENEVTVIATHWGVISVILSYYLSGGISGYWKFGVNNGGMAVINFNDNFPVLEKLT